MTKLTNTLFPIEFDVEDDWTFNKAPTRELTHCYHDYPARMIPQIAGKLLDQFGNKAKTLFDPYCGTGTSLVEGLLRGLKVCGTDINPLAQLIAKAKTAYIDPEIVRSQINDYRNSALQKSLNTVKPITIIKGITDLEFWFKPAVIKKLTVIKEYIKKIKNSNLKLFFNVAFSETIRESSNSRSNEFKLFKYPPEILKIYDPDVFKTMSVKLERNYNGLVDYTNIMNSLAKIHKSKIYGFNTIDGIPPKKIPKESIDIVITSPPYGDSHTTVAYGQYSRLSAAWLDLPEPDRIDQKLMGGSFKKQIYRFPCNELNDALSKISISDSTRAYEVSAFYRDLENSIKNVATCIRCGGYACYVVGNRIVKNVQLPTDLVIRALFENNGFSHMETFTRSIPNKRMPEKNSPTNVAGSVVSTMVKEYIVVMEKEKI